MTLKKLLWALVLLLAMISSFMWYSTRSTLVDVDGYKLETVVKGEGRPTVIFESGFGGNRLLWWLIQNRVSKHAKTLVYQRAGLGASDMRPEPRTAEQIAEELDLLIDKQELTPPFIFVAHSAGGLYARVFANKYPEHVAGIVLIDPATKDFYDHLTSNQPEGWDSIEDILNEYGATEGMIVEQRGLPKSIEQAENAWPLPSVPVAIYTATNVAQWPLDTEEMMQTWIKSHKKLSKSIPDAEHHILGDSSHASIMFNSEVSDKIIEFVKSARK